jgi:hypothetical protein
MPQFVFPWTELILHSDRSILDYSDVKSKLGTLGYPATLPKLTNDREVRSLLDILNYFSPEQEEDGRWLIFATNSYSMYDVACRIFPMSYALSYIRSIHPMSSFNLMNALRDPELAENKGIIPFGMEGLLTPYLVCFTDIYSNVRFLDSYTAQINNIFDTWAKNKVALFLPVMYTGEWKQKNSERLMEHINHFYGAVAHRCVVEKAEIMFYHDEDARVVPRKAK